MDDKLAADLLCRNSLGHALRASIALGATGAVALGLIGTAGAQCRPNPINQTGVRPHPINQTGVRPHARMSPVNQTRAQF